MVIEERKQCSQVFRSFVASMVFLWTGFFISVYGQNITPDLFSELKYRYIGPDGNRVTAIIGQPGNPNVIYSGWATGGVWKSTNGGIDWDPIFDDQDVMTIGSLAMAPSDPQIIWVGTGETAIRQGVSIGNGIYKSTNGGKTFQCMGLEKTGRISRILIDPQNPNIVLAGSLGHCWGPQQERGVFRTPDGGKTWERVLFADENTGVSDMDMDPKNPRNIIAGMWPLKLTTHLRTSGGPGGGIFRSQDGGLTWKKIAKGLPVPPTGKIAVRYAPSNPDRVYALIETAQFEFKGVLWRSDDGGDSWSLISHDHELQTRAQYYTKLCVAVEDEDEVYFLATNISKSTDGGRTSVTVAGGDYHDMWIDPMLPDRMLIGNDRGALISVDHGKTWNIPQLPTGQMYHVSVDNRIPYFVYGNRQDGPSRRGPSNSLTGGRIPVSMWQAVGGGESGFTFADPADNNIIWSSSYDGDITRLDFRTGQARNVKVWPESPIGTAPKDHDYRWNWTAPLFISPHDHNKVYYGSQVVHMTTDGGQSWQVISPDLTLNDKSTQTGSGGLVEDNLGVDIGNTLFAIAESPIVKDLIWVGSNDGQVHVTRNGGKEWVNVSKNFMNIPKLGIVSNIEPSRYDAGTAYISLDFSRMNLRDPYVLKTINYGQTWEVITLAVPKSVHSFVHVIKEDPVRRGMLYLGTENAIYVSINEGKNWIPLQNNMPHAPVDWLVIQEHFSDLVVATYGRGFWIMDDITPIRQLNDTVLQSEAHLFKPRSAYRFHDVVQPFSFRSDADGFNPPYGAAINYYLKDVPKEDVTITILEGSDIVRSFKGTKNKGINRVYWNLRYASLPSVKIRTLPYGHPADPRFIPSRLQFNEDGFRQEGGESGLLAVPGTYTVRLTLGNKTLTESLEVKKDPNSLGTVEDIREQNKIAFEVIQNINAVTKIINGIEWTRRQLLDLKILMNDDSSLESLRAELKGLEKKFVDFERNFRMVENTGATNNNLRWGIGLRSRISGLYRLVQQQDFRPTVQCYEMHKQRTGEVANFQNIYDNLITVELSEFNKKLREKSFPMIVIPKY